MNDFDFMQLAIDEANISYKLGEVPVGAVIVNSQGIVIAQGHNLRKTNNDATAHAEIVTIRLACKNLSSYRLDNCSIYVTLEPCIMCLGAILCSRISNIVYGASYTGACSMLLNNFDTIYQKTTVRSGVLEDKCNTLLAPFFQERLNKRNAIKQLEKMC